MSDELKCEAWDTSADTGEITKDGVRILRYDVRGVKRHEPPSTATTRSARANRWLNRDNLVDVLHKIDGQWVTIPGSVAAPLPVRSGTRTLRAVQRHSRNTNLYVIFNCDCGTRDDYVAAKNWRIASHDTGCHACIAQMRKSSQRPGLRPLPRKDTKAIRAAQRFAELTRLPYERSRAR